MALILKTFLYRSKSCCTWAISLYSGENGCNQAKVVVFGKKLLYSGKSGFFCAKVALFGKKMLFLGKVVVFGQKLF